MQSQKKAAPEGLKQAISKHKDGFTIAVYKAGKLRYDLIDFKKKHN